MPRHTCPTCGKRFTFERLEDHATYPFCGERCRLADLGAWFDGRYVISRSAEAESADAPEPPAREGPSTAKKGVPQRPSASMS